MTVWTVIGWYGLTLYSLHTDKEHDTKIWGQALSDGRPGAAGDLDTAENLSSRNPDLHCPPDSSSAEGEMWSLALLLLFGAARARGIAISPDFSAALSSLAAHAHPAHTHVSVLDPEGVFTVFWTPGSEVHKKHKDPYSTPFCKAVPKHQFLQEQREPHTEEEARRGLVSLRQEVVWEIHARTLGWIGFGFSGNGRMAGADIVTGWVADGRLFLQDRHGVGETTPPLDQKGDWRALHARENATHTVLVVARAVNTCDSQDFVLTNETVRLIYAWGDTDPTGDTPGYHGMRRGNRFALALLPFHRPVRTPETESSSVQTWQVRQEVTLPPGRHTFYWCHMEKVPAWETKHQYIGFDMLYGRHAREHLHHAVAFECLTQDGSAGEEVFEQYVGHVGHECYTPNMPPAFYKCERFLINWAIGSEGELLPDHVGYPLGERHGGATYVLFQTHYDNKPLHRDLTVEWGMDIYYTNKLRKYDAGNIGLGHALLFSLVVPPSLPYWKVAGHCDSACTQAAIPDDGVSVFMVFLHSHYLARAIRLRHFRGDRELKPMAVDSHFDADFQQSRRLSSEVRLLPGDHLTVECDYDSRGRNKSTFTGWAAEDEMCQAFINYYPRVDMALCRSSPHPDSLAEAFALPPFQKNLDLNTFIFDPKVGSEGGGEGESYQERLQRMPWKDFDFGSANVKLLEGEQVVKCQLNYGVNMKISTNTTGYPEATPFVPPEDPVCSRRRRPQPTGHALTNDAGEAAGGRARALLGVAAALLLVCVGGPR
ncbi:LOW QUALITY PROTEIN: DBH-like monooxygenase protein 1 [Penaeus chinensis]|uniref:LOW QUALITY PROTEIN: DBH-like monooxygenase protein 1 n=1 Tax=Penaeus chinensis TaxID=139456 RepID=UPI001FB5DFF0|nr:LOW QUALITY PROTEIN: DBH-like monooxygenase protein 1 [Penaeus chinensis]